MKLRAERFSAAEWFACISATAAVTLLCICVGSAGISASDVLSTIYAGLFGLPPRQGAASAIILSVRLPRVLSVGMVGASLSLCGAAMQGLLKNPLADGSTLGVSSGASLGAVIAIALGFQTPAFAGGGVMLFAILSAFLSLLFILTLAYRLDCSLATNTIILIGVIFTMLANSIISLIVTFAGPRVNTIMFWTMGSLSGSNYFDFLALCFAFLVFGTAILLCARELNAFAIGEENARSVGVSIRRVKLVLLIASSALIGVSVSIGGTIGFVGLVIPHMARMLVGANHQRLLPSSAFFGACFLMLADLLSRVVLNPLELPIGVVTSLIGAIAFIYIFYSSRKVR